MRKQSIVFLLLLACPLKHVLHHLHFETTAQSDGGVAWQRICKQIGEATWFSSLFNLSGEKECLHSSAIGPIADLKFLYLQTLWPLRFCRTQIWRASRNPAIRGETPWPGGRCPTERKTRHDTDSYYHLFWIHYCLSMFIPEIFKNRNTSFWHVDDTQNTIKHLKI